MATAENILRITRSNVFDRLLMSTRNGFKETPMNLEPLSEFASFLEISRCRFSETYPIALNILSRGIPGELAVAAQSYTQKFNDLRQEKGQDLSCVKRKVEALVEAHQIFRSKYIEILEQSHPSEPFCIRKNSPRTLNLFLRAWIVQIKKTPDEKFNEWKAAMDVSSEALIPIFWRLAILKLLEEKTLAPPELLTSLNEEISDLRTRYETLSETKKKEVHSLCIEEVTEASEEALEIFRGISDLQYRVEQAKLNGVLRLVYQEGKNYCEMLKGMIPCKEVPCRAVLLSALKQQTTPLILNTPEAQESLKRLQMVFRRLTPEQQEEFENAFLNVLDDSEDRIVYELLMDTKDLIFYWDPTFPSLLLAN